MAKKPEIDQENFEKFLLWLNTDRELAAQKYEATRVRLIKIFYARGCHIAEELADVCFDRVIKKISTIAETYEGDPALYCYGVAKNVFREYARQPKTEEVREIVLQIKNDLTETESDYHCLNKCLAELKPAQRELIQSYYKEENLDKIKRRKEIERELKVTNELLRVRIFRIRKILQECIRKCNKQES